MITINTKKIQDIIKSKEYDFLRTNEHLKDRIIFLTFGGSNAYGTSTPDSDVDIRGCSFNNKSDLIGMSDFEQVVDENTDTTVYSFNKLIKLICDCNPKHPIQPAENGGRPPTNRCIVHGYWKIPCVRLALTYFLPIAILRFSFFYPYFSRTWFSKR